MNLYDELRELVAALGQAGIDYAICGGVALAFHGHPRFTKDIDLLVREQDLDKVRKAVAACGFTVEGGRVPFRIGKPDELIIPQRTRDRMVTCHSRHLNTVMGLS